MENCNQVNIPQTDNTELACDPLISEECIVITEDLPFIGTQVGDSGLTLIRALVDKLKEQQRQINQLRTIISNL